jgi:tetratricopeptide (TPR) repeat protein
MGNKTEMREPRGAARLNVRIRPFFVGLLPWGLLLLTAGCAPISLSALAANLNHQNDLELVCEGSPAFLLLIDSLIVNDPNNERLLENGIRAYASYAAVAGECGRPERSSALSAKAHDYGLTLLRQEIGITPKMSLAEFNRAVAEAGRAEIGPLFWGAYGWALWIADQKGSPGALADLPKVEQLMRRVVVLDDTYHLGSAHLFLGINYGSKPAMYGGNPELARHHFERALAINQRNFLPVQLAYAEYYARPQQDRELYRQLLEEVLNFDPALAPEQKLGNLVAQTRARRLLAAIDEYF